MQMKESCLENGDEQRKEVMMIKAEFTLDDIIQRTHEIGDDWALAHAKRLLELVRQIGADLPYDLRIIEFAAYMHDWGAFPKYIQKGVEHAIRSRQVVSLEILPYLDLTAKQKMILLETIELHDYRDPRPPQSNEALLLREADMLEFLGMIGMAREFARGPKNVDPSYKRILSRRYGIQGRFRIPAAQAIAQIRLQRMEEALGWLLEESFGTL
jgi:HD superfamily phosphodiesterase